MLSKELSSQVLTISCAYNPPKGGVAQVVYTYSQEVYPVFKSVVNSKFGKFRNFGYAIWGILRTFWILLTDSKIQIVHIHSASRISFYRSMFFVKLTHLFRKKAVLHIHGGGFKEFYNTNPVKIKRMLASCEAIITLTEGWHTFFSKEIGLSNIWTVNNIVPQPQIHETKKCDNILHLLFLGLIDDAKGIFDLLEVLRDNRTTFEGKLVLHVGGNGQTSRLQQYIIDNQLENLVTFEGWVSGEKKIALLNLADIFILPSYIEGLPIAILEALSYGVPVLATPVGGIPEIINTQNGWLFTPGDKDQIKVLLEMITIEPDSVYDKKNTCIDSVSQNLPDEISKRLESLYNTILSK